MKTEPQARSELAHIATLIENIPVAMMTTTETDGGLRSRPMTVLRMDADGALWFFTDRQSATASQLGAANLSFGEASTQTYVSLSGRSEIDIEREHMEALWTPQARAWFPEGPDSAALVLLKFSPDRADYWDADERRMVRQVGLIVAGSGVEPGEHGVYRGLSDPAPPAGASN